MIKELIKSNRSYRRFDESNKISNEDLAELVDLARLSPSAANKQPLKYFLSYEKSINEKVFPTLGWAGYLHDWQGPVAGERPSAYILILGDTTISTKIDCDHGIAAQSILLGAREKGLGGCIFASINKKELQTVLNLKAHLEILLVIALGRPIEQVVLEDLPESGSIKYYRDENQVHHVPKRSLSDIII